MQDFSVKNFDALLGLKGFSDALLKNHFTLYQGYVTNANKLAQALGTFSREGKGSAPEYAEMKRRFGWEFNGMRLHEYYFGNLCRDYRALEHGSDLYAQIAADFGSFAAWEADFRATGAMRGIGWVALSWDPVSHRLWNAWIDEHDTGILAGSQIVLMLDVFEHAFMIDYGLKRADYIEAYFNAIDWQEAERRFQSANRELQAR